MSAPAARCRECDQPLVRVGAGAGWGWAHAEALPYPPHQAVPREPAVGAMTPHGEAPARVVAVVGVPGGQWRYWSTVVYELRARGDGVMTYRLATRKQKERRSERLIREDGAALAAAMGIPFWPFVRHHMTAEEAVARARQIEREGEPAPPA